MCWRCTASRWNALRSRSPRKALGSPDFGRIRIGVGRPPTTDPDRVAAYVLGRFREPRGEVALLVEQAADEAERWIVDETVRPPS